MKDAPVDSPKREGAPRKETSWAVIDALCAAQCTLIEIAAYSNVSTDTIERRIREKFDMTFIDYYAEKRGKGFVKLRRRQMQLAMAGNPAMLIWLGKQWLGQMDKARTEITGADGGAIAFTDADGEEVQRRLARLAAGSNAHRIPGEPQTVGAGGSPG